ncbi:MAG: hypothetical protein U1F59_09025 [Candidatus Competibacteraceae bacterium]
MHHQLLDRIGVETVIAPVDQPVAAPGQFGNASRRTTASAGGQASRIDERDEAAGALQVVVS